MMTVRRESPRNSTEKSSNHLLHQSAELSGPSLKFEAPLHRTVSILFRKDVTLTLDNRKWDLEFWFLDLSRLWIMYLFKVKRGCNFQDPPLL
ncbi:hypothetical protein SLA2020_385160 [Shorea laevis]